MSTRPLEIPRGLAVTVGPKTYTLAQVDVASDGRLHALYGDDSITSAYPQQRVVLEIERAPWGGLEAHIVNYTRGEEIMRWTRNTRSVLELLSASVDAAHALAPTEALCELAGVLRAALQEKAPT